MSYTYLLEQGEESSAEYFSGIPASVLSRSSHTADACCCNGSGTECCHASRSGTTCEHSTGGRGADALTLSQEDSRAKTSAQQGEAQESTANEAGSGESSHGWFAKWDRASCSWRTAQCSLLAGLDEFSETWPQCGTMRTGACWALTTPALRTDGNESGLWQTPVADDAVNRAKGKVNSRGEPKLSAQVKLWPTPNQRDWKDTGATQGNRKSPNLGTMVHQWGTPRASDGMKNKLRNIPEDHNCRSRLEDQVAQIAGPGGQLNPTWVEWLMGWPLGWTDCAPLATDKFQQWLRSHGGL